MIHYIRARFVFGKTYWSSPANYDDISLRSLLVNITPDIAAADCEGAAGPGRLSAPAGGLVFVVENHAFPDVFDPHLQTPVSGGSGWM